MKKVIIILISYFILTEISFSQKETYNWYFGFEAGLTFNSPDINPKPLLDGAIGGPTSLIGSLNWQSCVMSDSSGNLLFYSDGVTVWDYNHQVIPFGKNIHDKTRGFIGSSIIIPYPLDNNKYFLFSTSEISNNYFNQNIDSIYTDGIRYSIIEITKNKDVVINQRNQLLNGKVSSHLLAVKHRNGRDLWIITHEWNSNRFISYLIDEFGIHDSVFSSVGTVYRRTNFIRNDNEANSIGYTKATVDGKFVAVANRGLGIVEIFDFDNSTGLLSNTRKIQLASDTLQNTMQKPNGVEFSPDGKKIYVSFNWYNIIGQVSSPGGIYQYDFSKTDIASITKSEYLIKHDSVNYYALQLGADGKIYNARFYHTQVIDSICRYLDVIQNPNELGKDCNYKFSGFYLCNRATNDTNHFTRLCLPQFIMDFMVYHAGISGDTSICEDKTLVLKAVQNRLIPNATYQWKNSKGQILSSDSLLIFNNVTLDMEGYYYLHSEGSGFISDDSIYVIVHPKPDPTIKIEGDSIICSNSSVVLKSVYYDTGCKYKWSTSETTPSITVSKEGKYQLKVYSKFGCEDSSFVTIRHLPLPEVKINVIGDTVLCNNDSTLLIALPSGIGHYDYKWNTGDTTYRITVRDADKYQVVITDSCGLSDTASIDISKQDISPYITQSSKLCEDGNIYLSCFPSASGLKYKWSTGETTQAISISQPGTYSVIIQYNSKCSDTASISVVSYPKPIVSIKGDSLLCAGNSVKLSVEQNFVSYRWNTGETGNSIEIDKGGLYQVEVEDTNGCIGKTLFSVKDFQFALNGIIDVDFGKKYIGSSSKQNIILINKSNHEINISKIYTAKDTPVFSINTNKPIPIILKPDETIEVEVLFSPTETGSYLDSLIVESDEPCANQISSEIRGESFAQSMVWLPDTTGKVGDSGFCIPLRTNLIEDYKQPLSFTAKIKFDASAFLPDSIYNSYIIGKNCFVELRADNIIPKLGHFRIDEFCGKVVLADEDKTQLLIDEFNWSDSMIETDKQEGSMTISGLCLRNLSRIILSDKINLIIKDPVTDYIEISFPPSEKSGTGIVSPAGVGQGVDIRIFDLLGACVIKVEQTSPSVQRIDISHLAPGVYFVRIGDLVQKFIKL